MHTLKKQTKEILSRDTGLSYEQISVMSPSEWTLHAEKLTGKKVRFPGKIDTRKIPRGNPLLAKNRMRTIEEVDSRLDEIVKNG